jgi:hypothetical protein
MKDEDIARVVHEGNRALCRTQGDDSQPAWDDAPEWQRSSALAGVAMIRANPSSTPEQSHESWLEEKRRTGWTYGPVKDTVKKEHPCFVPYEQLPANQQVKDHLFGSIVRTLLDA